MSQSGRSASTACTIKHINISIFWLNEQHKEFNLIRVADYYRFCAPLSLYWKMSALYRCWRQACMHACTHTQMHTVVKWHPNGPCNPLGCNLCLCAVRLVQILNFCRFKQRAQSSKSHVQYGCYVPTTHWTGYWSKVIWIYYEQKISLFKKTQ